MSLNYLFIWNKSNNSVLKKDICFESFLHSLKQSSRFTAETRTVIKMVFSRLTTIAVIRKLSLPCYIFLKEAQNVSLRETKYKSWKTDGKKEEKQHEEFVNGVRHAVSRHPHVPFETSCIDSITSAASCRGNTRNANMGACYPTTNQKLGGRVSRPIRAWQPHPCQPQREWTRERDEQQPSSGSTKFLFSSDLTYTRKTTFNLHIYNSHCT